MKSRPVRLTFRVQEEAYQALRARAASEQRSLAGMVKAIIARWLEQERKESKSNGKGD